ncbi:AMP-binding protein [Conexibacter sp. S30A1]|uniref:AMP-binding protein n=1 Tax=Conexibacter sp. S30A1 TaxID=2937800 RepID=UPI00200F25BE|nr:AMP-binding protein [Conexibacter sp. S30A1]
MYDWLERAAARRPETIALEAVGDRTLTYAQLLTAARRAAAARKTPSTKQVVAPTRGVAHIQTSGARFAVSLHGALLAGVTAVPVDGRLSVTERRLRHVAEPPGPDVATVMFTSGTTAAPKPVHLTLANWEANAIGSALALGLDRNERWLCVMPLAHVGGLSILLRSTLYATTVVLHERYDTEAVLAELMDPKRAITLVSVVPTMLSRLLDAGLSRPPTLRFALLGGGPIPPSLVARAAAAGVPVATTYGMTEGCSQLATFGFALHGVTLQVAADGEVLVRGASIAANTLSEDGWLHTGDIGALDANKRLRIIGRRSETIVSGGENVAPAEVEAVLLEHPAVADAGVFAKPDPEWGERVVAAVVLRSGQQASPQELERHVAERLARFKVPKEIEFRPSLPRTVSGKLLRRQLA